MAAIETGNGERKAGVAKAMASAISVKWRHRASSSGIDGGKTSALAPARHRASTL